MQLWIFYLKLHWSTIVVHILSEILHIIVKINCFRQRWRSPSHWSGPSRPCRSHDIFPSGNRSIKGIYGILTTMSHENDNVKCPERRRHLLYRDPHINFSGGICLIKNKENVHLHWSESVTHFSSSDDQFIVSLSFEKRANMLLPEMELCKSLLIIEK